MTSTRPPVSSPSLTLVHPTKTERTLIWKATHPQWGGALSLTSYLHREEYLLEGPLSNNGGQIQWMLTDGSLPPDERPILASCETLKKAALVASPNGELKEAIAHGVASVFTFPEMRGRGYAGKMMQLLGQELSSQETKKKGDAVFSVLYSDIGKKFYDAVGWKPFESTHLEFTTASPSTTDTPGLQPITMENLPELTTRDEQLLRKALASPGSSKKRVALTPDLDSMNWHLSREDFMCNHIFSRLPTVRGAVYTPEGSPNSRVWAIWTRNFYGGLEKPEKNSLFILRFVVEDEGISDEELGKAIAAIVGLAQKEGKEWHCPRIEWWNPTERVRDLAQKNIEGAEFVVREDESIASLQWFGDGSVDDLEWLANEKFGWC